MKSRKEVFKDNLNFYHTFFQFNPPYPILMDGSFICSIIANGIDDICAHINDICGSNCELFTTNCVLSNLNSNFPNNHQIQAITEKLQVYDCARAHPYQNSKCMYTCVSEVAEMNRYKRVIGPPMGKHYVQGIDPRFILATQNISVVETLREVVGVPLMYFNADNLCLEKPAVATLEWVSANKLKNMELLDMEREILQRALLAAEAKKPRVEIEKTAKCAQGKRKKEDNAHEREKESDNDGVLRHEGAPMKRTREPSPDICDLPRLASNSSSGSRGLRSKKAASSNSGKLRFDKYKTLYRESDMAGDKVQVTVSLRGNSSAAHAPVAPIPLWTNTSSFEFE